MIYLLVVALLGISGVLVYKKRFSSDFKIGGLYFVQLYYMFIGPVICTLMITLGQEILNRPQEKLLFIPSGVLFNLYGMFVILSAVASGIHSTTTSIFQSFLKNELPILRKWGQPLNDSTFRRLTHDEKHLVQMPTFHVNEKFHGGFSHNLLFISTIFATMFLGLLELNHPVEDPSSIHPMLIILMGVLMSVIMLIGVIRSTYLSYSLVASMFASGVLYFFASKILFEFPFYPIATVCLIAMMVLSVGLAVVGLIFLASHSLSKTVVKRLYPKEHWFQEGMSLELLKVKIKRDWF